MYYNRILRIWVFDPLDYFLISALIGSLAASYLKKHFSEKESMKRLRDSIISKSILVKSKIPISKSRIKREKVRRVTRFALNNRGGQFEESQASHQLSNELFKLAQEIKKRVESLAAVLKERELQGALKIFFKSGRLVLQLILHKCNIRISYSDLTEGLSTQVIVFTITSGGAAGFTLSWLSVGASLVTPPLIASVLVLRSFTQQVINQREYSKFKRILNEMLKDEELQIILRPVFTGDEPPTVGSLEFEMGPSDFDANPPLKHDFNLESGEGYEEFIKAQMKAEFGLIENPTETQLEEIINRKVKPKAKTVYFRDFINQPASDGADPSYSDILDAEIVEEPIRVRSDNEL